MNTSEMNTKQTMKQANTFATRTLLSLAVAVAVSGIGAFGASDALAADNALAVGAAKWAQEGINEASGTNSPERGGVPNGARKPKNVIFFLGDGMGPASITAARIMAYKEEGHLNFELLKRTARIKTFSHDAQTTDSAPSMAAYMTGVKMNNEVLSMSSDTKAVAPGSDANGNKTINKCVAGNGTRVETLLELAKAAGMSTGAITTTELTHATPAATYSHICHRDAQYSIAEQLVPGTATFNAALGDGVDVLMGGGRNHFTPFDAASNKGGRADGRNLLTEMAAKGYQVAATSDELTAAVPGQKFIGLFSSKSHLEYELDRLKGKGEGATQPSIEQMTARAIELLSAQGKGYFLMVEGGRIDHALHGTNAKRALNEVIAMDNAVARAMAMTDPNDTLIIVTADHDHAMGFNGYPKRGNPILDVVRNYEDGKESKDADGNSYTTLVFGNGPNRPAVRVPVTTEQVMADDYLQESGVRLSSETHGGGDVKLLAGGAGASTFKGTIDNTKVFSLVRGALGL